MVVLATTLFPVLIQNLGRVTAVQVVLIAACQANEVFLAMPFDAAEGRYILQIHHDIAMQVKSSTLLLHGLLVAALTGEQRPDSYVRVMPQLLRFQQVLETHSVIKEPMKPFPAAISEFFQGTKDVFVQITTDTEGGPAIVGRDLILQAIEKFLTDLLDLLNSFVMCQD